MSTSPDPSATALAARLREALTAADADAELRRRGRWLSTRCLISLGTEQLLVDIQQGRITVPTSWPPLTSWRFALHGSTAAWTQHWQSPPPPGWHDLLALAKGGELRIEGDLHPFMSHLQYFKDLLARPRTAGAVPA